MMMAPKVAAAVFAWVVASCSSCGHKEEKVGVVVGPPLTIDRDASAPAPYPDVDAEAPHGPPVTATFIDLSASGAPISVRTCEQVVVSAVQGDVNADNDRLAEGDYLITQGEGTFTVKGAKGLALVAAVRTDPCTPRHPKEAPPPLTHRIVRAGAAPELTWGGGKMHARLDVESELAGAYVGRISGAAPIAEHAHDASWEIVCTVQARGFFTLDGQTKPVGPRQVLMIPPGAKHAFTPEAGSTLSAIQFYWPRGPEQRFRELDKKDRHSGKR
ncbi:hypothetical protein LVJ94_14930 [Pendulispora rubella]|uniref:Cupin 2 conserved barrel domain-containing protein n=1 Tax=Pendulispora rubella TaxID=2741070 RepID=A0ABZ2LC67_9BACT